MVRTGLLLCILSFILLTTPASATPRFIYGLEFQLETFEELDDSLVKIVIDGKPSILKRTNLDLFIVQQAFTNDNFSPNVDAHIRFVLRAINDDATKIATVGFEALLIRHGGTRFVKEYIERVFGTLGVMPVHQRFYKEVLKISPKFPKNIQSLLLVEILTNYEMESELEVLSLVAGNEDVFLREAKRKFSDLLSSGQERRAEFFLGRLQKIFREQQRLITEMNIAMKRVLDIRAVISEGTVENNLALVDACLSDVNRRQLFRSIVVEAMHLAADLAIKDNRKSDAMQLLSRIDPNWRTPETHSLARQLFFEFADTQNRELGLLRMQLFFEEIARNDSAFQDIYLSQLEKSFDWALKNKEIRYAESFFDAVRRIRPDPSNENDVIREVFALFLSKEGMPQKARQILEQGQGKMSFITKLRFELARLSGLSITWLLLSLALFISACLTFYLSGKRRSYQRSSKQYKPSFSSAEEQGSQNTQQQRNSGLFENSRVKDGGEDIEDDPPPFRVRSSSATFVRKGQYDDYYRCLSKLGLRREATLADIKTAYRNLAKKVHPDNLKEHDERSKDQFLELQNHYQRALSLRKDLKID